MPLSARAQTPPAARTVVAGLTQPVAFIQDPANPVVQFLVEQRGRIRVVSGGVLLGTDFLDLRPAVSSGGERGLLGLAFEPTGAGRRFFVNFTNPEGHTVVARFQRSANPLVADAASRFDLRWGTARRSVIDQPFANHNGGDLAFGPDGYLYVGLGDGGSGDDPGHRAQNPAEFLGKMLRIDVNVPDGHATGYQVPPTNPFVSRAGTLPEIWSFGLRNPWRYTFDAPARGGTGALVIGDVGQGQWEEIDYEPPGRGGRNYGWRNREGAHAHVASLPPAFTPLIDPVHEYGRASGQSVTGGFVYRGSRLGSGFRGRYFFADYVSGRIWSVALTIDPASGEATAGARLDHTAELAAAVPVGNISAFGVDADGELHLVNHSGGTVIRIERLGGVPAAPTGLRIVR